MNVETLFSISLVLATLFTTMVAGFLFAFAVVAMPGIKNLTDREFIRTFQVMDAIIQNNQPLFILVWAGSVLLLLISTVLGFGELEGTERVLLIIATLIYIFGVQLTTLTINVPLNNQLQAVNVDTIAETEYAGVRHNFEPRWNQWNQIRTVLATVSSLLLLILLVLI